MANEDRICPECGSNNVHLLALSEFNEYTHGCQKCYHQWSFSSEDLDKLIAELRQALLDNAPTAWRTRGALTDLEEQMKSDADILRVAIHFVVGTGKFIRQGGG